MKHIAAIIASLFFSLMLHAQVAMPPGKGIYIPKDLQGMDLQNPESNWSFHRMECTENFVIFWEKGFGPDLANPPQLDGQEMKINLPNLKCKLEQFYRFFRDELQFAKPGSKSDKYRMMVMLNYSLEGTAYGGDYDGVIGALWVTPNRLQDEKLNCIAHELGHSFQCQITADGQGDAWGGCGFFEMASQWMLWQVNPDWPTDENYHLQAFLKDTHKAYLHLDNIYRSPYVLEYWSMLHGLPFIAELFRQGRKGEDPVTTYKRLSGLSQQAFCDEMYQAYTHFINWDMPRVKQHMAPYACQYQTKLLQTGKDTYQVLPENCPENYGFNAIPMEIPAPGKKLTITFQGMAGAKGYENLHADKADWRYGFVAVTQKGETIFGEMHRHSKGKVTFVAPKDEPLSHLYLLVMGAPTEHWKNPEPTEEQPHPKEKDAQWGYQLKIEK